MVVRSGSEASAARSSGARAALVPVLIVGATLAAYYNSFPGSFVLDDLSSVIENTSIRQLWPPGPALHPPPEAGVAGRPLANLTFALNHTISGLHVWSYHALNLAIHIGAALLLFGVVRRTLMQPVLRARLGAVARPLAGTAATLWAVHPLATAAVNYVSQRTELLMGFFYLLTLYGFIRSVETGSWRWRIVTVAACALGMMSKEVMLTAPLAVLLYDGAFVAGTWQAAWRERRRLYWGLAATWLVLAWLIATSRLAERGVGFDLGVTGIGYALTQSRAALLYLGLALWPDPLVFDYGWSFQRWGGGAVLCAFVCVGLLSAAGFALRRRSLAGAVGCLVFLMLAPTSSFIPIIQQPVAESRMYLPLAVVAAALVVGLFTILRRFAVVPLTIAIVALGWLTAQRNAAYRSEIALWTDTIAKEPRNARAHGNLSAAFLRIDRVPEAIAAAEHAVRLEPGYAAAHHNLALGLARSGRLADAIERYEAALRANPNSADTHTNLGEMLVQAGRNPDAVEHFNTALRLNPRHAKAHNNLGVVLLQLGRIDEAADHDRAAVAIDPVFAEAYYNLGNALARLGDRAAAMASYEAALRLQPSFARAHNNLGVLHLQAGETAAATARFEAALRIEPAYEQARRNLERAQTPAR